MEIKWYSFINKVTSFMLLLFRPRTKDDDDVMTISSIFPSKSTSLQCSGSECLGERGKCYYLACYYRQIKFVYRCPLFVFMCENQPCHLPFQICSKDKNNSNQTMHQIINIFTQNSFSIHYCGIDYVRSDRAEFVCSTKVEFAVIIMLTFLVCMFVYE